MGKEKEWMEGRGKNAENEWYEKKVRGDDGENKLELSREVH